MPAPTKAQLKPIVTALFVSKKFTGKNADDLADVIAEAIAQSLTMLIAQVKVAPGIVCTPAVTVSPGLLV